MFVPFIFVSKGYNRAGGRKIQPAHLPGTSPHPFHPTFIRSSSQPMVIAMDTSRTSAPAVLLAGLLPEETALIEKLIAVFDIEACHVSLDDLNTPSPEFDDREICLAVFHADEQFGRQDRYIRRISELLERPVPLLVLVPENSASHIREYVHAGADDFSLLPLDEDSFSVRFYILLEWGQALAGSPKPSYPWDEHGQQSKKNLWRRLVGRLQEGISFFAPRNLTGDEEGRPIFNKWQQIRKLGSGGFGEVWLVQEIGREQLAVAKIPHDRGMNIRALRSAAILKRLIHHPNIAGLLEVVKEGGKYILIQEYVDGPTLQQLIEKGLEPHEKEKLFRQLLAVTAYSHHHRIMHRDIKPENILVDQEGKLKLLDFGIARDLTWQKPDSVSEGSLEFMSPEQLEGQSSLASDVWALGVILYILTTDRMPFCRDNSPHPMDVTTEMDIKSPILVDPRIPVKLDRIIMRCLQKDPAKRYPDAIELQSELLKTLPGFGEGKLIPNPLWGWSVG
ncbi:MAG: serine/threonine protein kinase [Desulfobulbaceae bacterium]|nr:MAG: serine/threonine protein kinase [Desulfobulbaceae bacterium]